MKMNRLFRIVALTISLLVCHQAFAQYLPDWESGDLVKKRATIAVNGQKLDKSAASALVKEVGGPDLAHDWDKAVSKRKWGTGLTIGGFSVATLGTALSIGSAITIGAIAGVIGGMAGGEEGAQQAFEAGARNPLCVGSLIAAGVGAAAGVVGIIELSSANSELKEIVKECNSSGPASGEVSLTLGATQNGFGLALRF